MKPLLFSGLLLSGVLLAACNAPQQPAEDTTMMQESTTPAGDESIQMEGTSDGMEIEKDMMNDESVENDTTMEDDTMTKSDDTMMKEDTTIEEDAM